MSNSFYAKFAKYPNFGGSNVKFELNSSYKVSYTELEGYRTIASQSPIISRVSTTLEKVEITTVKVMHAFDFTDRQADLG